MDPSQNTHPDGEDRRPRVLQETPREFTGPTDGDALIQAGHWAKAHHISVSALGLHHDADTRTSSLVVVGDPLRPVRPASGQQGAPTA
jgi:hypothetical protein